MFEKSSDLGYHEAVPAVYRKTLVFGEKTLLTEFRMQKGSSLPAHAHPYEQTGYLVRGRLRLTIDDESFDVSPGDSWSIGSNIPHCAEILEDSVAVEVFSPVRQDYLPA